MEANEEGIEGWSFGGSAVSQQLETYTDQLLDIIQRIQVQRGNCILRVRRGGGVTEETGMVTFVNGKPTDARAGRRTGSEAVNWMSTWRACWFAFTSNDPSLSLNKILHAIDRPPGKHAAEPIDTLQGGNTPPIPDFLAISPLRKHRGIVGDRALKNDTASSDIYTPLPPTFPAIELIVPMMVVRLEMALSMLETAKLTRSHRQLLLLTDGKRHVGELARIAQRSQEEVYKLLQELEQVRIIRLMKFPTRGQV